MSLGATTAAALALWLTAGVAVPVGAAERQARPAAHAAQAHRTAARKAARSRDDTVRSDDAPDIVTYGRREDVQQFAEALAQRQNLEPAWVRGQLAQARYLPSVAKYIMPPPAGTAKNWAAYRARFVEPVRLRAGRAFWAANESWLAQAEARYGVPPEIVVGIIGVETIYGRQTGNFRVIDALATLSFDFPTGRRDRSGFFRDELEQYLRWCQDQGFDPQALRGSFAGAIGMPQFMPSSLRKYAVDFDGDGRVDLQGSTAIAGEWGHNPLPWPQDDERPGAPCYCGKHGCIETWLAGPSLSRDHFAHTQERFTAEVIASRAEAGDLDAQATLMRYADRMARALASVINVVDPDVIVLGGGVSNIEALYLLVREALPRWVFSDYVDVPLVRAIHGDASGVRGAAWLW